MTKRHKSAVMRAGAGIDAQTRRAIESIAEIVEVFQGSRGNKLDRAVTFRDLQQGEGVKVVQQLVQSTINDGPGLPIPPGVTGLAIDVGLEYALLRWDQPSQTANHALSIIYRVETDASGNINGTPAAFTDATEVGVTPAPQYSDLVTPGATYVYWVRHLGQDGRLGPISSTTGTLVTIDYNPSRLLEELTEQITKDKFVQALQAEIDLIASHESQISTLNTTTSNQASSITQLQSSVYDPNTGLIDKVAAAELSISTNTSDINNITSELTLKVQADGRVAGIGLIAGSTSGTQIYLSADRVAFLNSYNDSTASAGNIPFIVENGVTFIDDARIRKLTAEKLTGGGAVLDTLTVIAALSLPSATIKDHHIDPALWNTLVRRDPNAITTGGQVTATRNFSAGLGSTASPSFTSAGSTQNSIVINIDGGGPSTVAPPSITYRIKSGATYLTLPNGQTTHTVTGTVYDINGGEPGTTRVYRGQIAYQNTITFTPPAGTTTYTIEVTALSSQYPSNSVISITANETVVSSDGVTVNTDWADITNKPSTFPPSGHTHTWADITNASVNTWGGLRHSTTNGYIDFGPANASYAHIYTDRPYFYFNKRIFSDGGFAVVGGAALEASSINSNGRTAFSFLNGSAALPINTNELLVSNSYADRSLVPTNGIYSSGKIRVDSADGIEVRRGLHGGYNESSPGSGTWGANIWAIGAAWQGTGYGQNYTPASYGLSWIRQTHPNVNVIASEGLYIYRNNRLCSAIGIDGMFLSSRLEACGYIHAKASGLSRMIIETMAGSQASGSQPRLEFRTGDNQDVQIRSNSYDSNRAPFGLHIERAPTNTQSAGLKAYLDVEGKCYAEDHVNTSDIRTKSDLGRIENGLSKVCELTGYTFMKDGSNRREAGYIAQDFEKVLPEGVHEAPDGLKQVSNSAMLGLLIEAIKDLKDQVDEIKERLNG